MRIVHLSDIHFSKKKINDFESFIIDNLVKELIEYSSKNKIDLIFITGDLLFQGGEGNIEEGFKLFEEKFINIIIDKIGIDKNNIFFIPGNHDIDRKFVKGEAKYRRNEAGIRVNLKDTESVNEFIIEDDENSIARVIDFKKFEKIYYKNYPEGQKQLTNFHSNFIKEIGNKKIGISCLNSAWRCGSDEDKGSIILGEYQITDSLRFINNCDLKLCLIHHQFEDFIEFDKETIKRYITKEYDILFCGHSHSGDSYSNTSSKGNTLISSVAPANWQYGIRHGSEEYYNGYTIMDINIDSGSVEISHRKYNHNEKQYIPDSNLGDGDGKSYFLLQRLSSNKKQNDKDESKAITNNKFPKLVSYFTGRKKELSNLVDAINNNIIIGIFGIGGSGKTTIIAKYIADLSEKDNIVLYDCTGTTNLDSLIKGTGYHELLKANAANDRGKLISYVELLNRDKKVIFLDNFHEIKDGLDELLEYATEKLSDAKIIIVSRDKYKNVNVNIKEINIGGLEEDSLNYVKEILKYREKEKEIEKFSEDELKEMCDKLKGHPLAIILAVDLICEYGETCKGIKEKIATYGYDSEKLSKRLIGYIIDDERLKKEEKEFLLNLSVFEGEITEDGINFITNGAYRKEIAIFIKKMMITKSETRYEIHPVIREFCYEKLVDKKELNFKAAKYYIQNNEKVEGVVEEKIYSHLLKAEKYKEIKDRIMLNGEKLINSGYKVFIKNTINLLRKHHEKADEFYLLEGIIKALEGDWIQAKEELKKCYESNHVEENIKILAEIKYCEILFKMWELKESLERLEKILKNIENSNWKKEKMECLNNIGVGSDIQGNYNEALDKYKESLSISREIGDKTGISGCLNNIGVVYKNQGNYNEALEKYKESLSISREIGDKTLISTCLNNIGMVYDKQGNYNEALKKYKESLSLSKGIGDKSGVSSCLNNIGMVYDKQGNYNEALKKYKESLSLSKEIGDKSGIGSCLNNIGGVYDTQGNYNEALDKYKEILSISKEIRNKSVISTCLNNIGGVYDTQGNYNEALDKYKESLSLAEEMGDKSIIGACLNNIGLVYDKQGNYNEALKKYKESLLISLEIGAKPEISTCLNNIGLVYFKQEKYEDALEKHINAFALNNIMFLDKNSETYMGKFIAIKKKMGYTKFKENINEIYKNKLDDELKQYINIEELTVESTIINSQKIGRNSECYCGSGKKYKKCCGKS